jgi:hypothetical protein
MAPPDVSAFCTSKDLYKMNTLSIAPAWCTFENIPTGPKAVSAAASCAFSLSTLEVAFALDSSSFAVTERKQPEIWRWAIIGDGGRLLEEGFEASRDDAKNAASAALHQVDSSEAL